MPRTGIVTDPIFLRHMETYPDHPENAGRLKAIGAMLAETGLDDRTVPVAAREATREEVCRVHTPAMYDRVAETDGARFLMLDPDTCTSPLSFKAALKAVGGHLELADRIRAGELDAGFAFCRPPGHHATPDASMGFCLFNNIAIAAAHLTGPGGLARVAIVDFDVHHGNGTQDAFYARSDVLYLSSHQSPHYPGTGSALEQGEGAGTGLTVNLPLPAGLGDDDLLHIYGTIAAPVLDAYRPQFILVSAGFDAHHDDPLAGLRATERFYAGVTGMLLSAARTHAEGRLMFTLEGGYDYGALRRSVRTVLEHLLAGGEPESGQPPRPSDHGSIIARRLREAHATHWQCLKERPQ